MPVVTLTRTYPTEEGAVADSARIYRALRSDPQDPQLRFAATIYDCGSGRRCLVSHSLELDALVSITGIKPEEWEIEHHSEAGGQGVFVHRPSGPEPVPRPDFDALEALRQAAGTDWYSDFVEWTGFIAAWCDSFAPVRDYVTHLEEQILTLSPPSVPRETLPKT